MDDACLFIYTFAGIVYILGYYRVLVLQHLIFMHETAGLAYRFRWFCSNWAGSHWIGSIKGRSSS